MTPLAATEAERLEFEAWMKSRPGYPYAGTFANLMWAAWQAARAMHRASAEPVAWLHYFSTGKAVSFSPDFYGYPPKQAVQSSVPLIVAPDRAPSNPGGRRILMESGMIDVASERGQDADRAPSIEPIIARQVATWRKEVARLQDLISTAEGAPSTDSAAGWISVEDRLPEAGVGVMVYSPPLDGEGPEDYRIDFDCIDPDDDDHASWLNHNEHYEHYCCVGKPEGSTGPRAEAPYTHWQQLPARPIAAMQPKKRDDGQ
jgi:hypothetical protein